MEDNLKILTVEYLLSRSTSSCKLKLREPNQNMQWKMISKYEVYNLNDGEIRGNHECGSAQPSLLFSIFYCICYTMQYKYVVVLKLTIIPRNKQTIFRSPYENILECNKEKDFRICFNYAIVVSFSIIVLHRF